MKRRPVAALLCLLAALVCGGCREKGAIPAGTAGGEAAPEGQLMASVQTREEAERIAALYGIELVDFQEPTALYKTGEDPDAVIRRGIRMGWPKLEKNRIVTLF